jgi:hypothetical protein
MDARVAGRAFEFSERVMGSISTRPPRAEWERLRHATDLLTARSTSCCQNTAAKRPVVEASIQRAARSGPARRATAEFS